MLTPPTTPAARAAAADPVRVLLYSHDAQGLGHVRRNLTIAHTLAARLPALVGRPVNGLLVTGVPEAAEAPLPVGFDRLVLPGVRKGSEGYEARARGLELDAVLSVRTRLLDAALAGVDPHLVIIDRHVHGIRGELRQPLQALRDRRPEARIVLGLREVLDSPHVVRAEWERVGQPSQLAQLLDAVWVYGDQSVRDVVETGEVPAELAPLITHTGYLANGRPVADDRVTRVAEPFVLTTVGGGSDGAAVLETAASARVPEGYRHLLVAGPQMAAVDRRRIARLAGERTLVLDRLDNVDAHIAAASAVVTMGGYNTVCEVLATGTPALVVPREVPRQEQLLRAQALAAVQAVDVARADELDPVSLSTWLARAAGTSVDRSHLSLDGLSAVSHLAADLLAVGADHSAPEVHHAA